MLFLACGRVAYLGPTAGALLFFSNCGVVIQQHSNPADIYIQHLAIVPGQEEQCRQRIAAICDKVKPVVIAFIALLALVRDDRLPEGNRGGHRGEREGEARFGGTWPGLHSADHLDAVPTFRTGHHAQSVSDSS